MLRSLYFPCIEVSRILTTGQLNGDESPFILPRSPVSITSAVNVQRPTTLRAIGSTEEDDPKIDLIELLAAYSPDH